MHLLLVQAMWLLRADSPKTRTGSRPFFPFLVLGLPYNPLKTKKGTLFIPRLLPGLEKDVRSSMWLGGFRV